MDGCGWGLLACWRAGGERSSAGVCPSLLLTLLLRFALSCSNSLHPVVRLVRARIFLQATSK